MSRIINRRKFFNYTAFSAAGLILGSKIAESVPVTNAASEHYNIMREVMKYRKIDAHEHVGLGGTIESQLEYADRLGIEKLEISKPISAESKPEATPEEFRKCNDSVLKAMKQYPDRYLGSCFVNPVYGKESLEEIKRCVDQGMIGLKVYNQVKINDPLFYPIIEKFIDLKMIILMHSFYAIGIGGIRTKYGNVNLMLQHRMILLRQQPDILRQCYSMHIPVVAETGNMHVRHLRTTLMFMLTHQAVITKVI